MVAAGATGGLCATYEALDQAVLPNAPPGVDRIGAVVIVGRRQAPRALPVDEETADARPVGQIAAHPRHGEVVRLRDAIDFFGLHVEDADRHAVRHLAR